MTRYCISTSKARNTGGRASNRFSVTAVFIAAASSNSRACVGTIKIRLTAPGRCPLLPARCAKRETPFGLPICTTVSTGRKSTPRSRLDVQTTTFSRPACSDSSTQVRISVLREPWCSAMMPAQSGRAAKICWYQISACPRVLVNTSVLPEDSSTGSNCGNIDNPRCPDQGKRSTSSGMSVVISVSRWMSANTIAPVSARVPNSTCMASRKFPMVALIPHMHKPLANTFNLDSASSICTPLLVPSSSCHSSTTTACNPAKYSPVDFCDNRMCKLSGVVINTSGGFFFCFARCALLVSPVLFSTRQGKSRCRIKSLKAAVISGASARIGVIQII